MIKVENPGKTPAEALRVLLMAHLSLSWAMTMVMQNILQICPREQAEALARALKESPVVRARLQEMTAATLQGLFEASHADGL